MSFSNLPCCAFTDTLYFIHALVHVTSEKVRNGILENRMTARKVFYVLFLPSE
jgi:hypothetical protein